MKRAKSANQGVDWRANTGGGKYAESVEPGAGVEPATY